MRSGVLFAIALTKGEPRVSGMLMLLSADHLSVTVRSSKPSSAQPGPLADCSCAAPMKRGTAIVSPNMFARLPPCGWTYGNANSSPDAFGHTTYGTRCTLQAISPPRSETGSPGGSHMSRFCHHVPVGYVVRPVDQRVGNGATFPVLSTTGTPSSDGSLVLKGLRSGNAFEGCGGGGGGAGESGGFGGGARGGGGRGCGGGMGSGVVHPLAEHRQSPMNVFSQPEWQSASLHTHVSAAGILNRHALAGALGDAVGAALDSAARACSA
mmetsp:Transcript_10194/g.26469  ORF Transcript_10194/g.26469 Transcript_10194/m.26469 type:complete len:267 (+) Transcript_10194:2640-3440(+)